MNNNAMDSTASGNDVILTRNQNKVASTAGGTSETLFTKNKAEREYMGVARGSEQIIFEMLSDLSVNRGAYVLREAYSNAVDATMAAGDMSKPVEIEVPDYIDSVYDSSSDDGGIAAKLISLNFTPDNAIGVVRVSDHGIGMSETDIRDYFLQYGGSKKRDDKDAIGSKGLGAKAPLAITDAFEVQSRKDGIETIAVINKEDGGSYARIMTRPTDKDNGTDVLIPVSDTIVLNQVRECARDIAKYNYNVNLVINGQSVPTMDKQPETVYAGLMTVGKDENGNDIKMPLYHTTFKQVPTSLSYNCNISMSDDIVLVIGGYPYQITKNNKVAQFVIVGQPGYLNFTPSRDEIRRDTYYSKMKDAIVHALEKHDMTTYIHNLHAAMNESSLDFVTHRFFSAWQKDDNGYSVKFNHQWHAHMSLDDVMSDGINLVDAACLIEDNGMAIMKPVPADTPAITFLSRNHKDKWNINRSHDNSSVKVFEKYEKESKDDYYWNYILHEYMQDKLHYGYAPYHMILVVGVDDITNEQAIKYCFNNNNTILKMYGYAPASSNGGFDSSVAIMLVPDGFKFSKPIEKIMANVASGRIEHVSYSGLHAAINKYRNEHKPEKTASSKPAVNPYYHKSKTLVFDGLPAASGNDEVSLIKSCCDFTHKNSDSFYASHFKMLAKPDYADTVFAITDDIYNHIRETVFAVAYMNSHNAFSKRYGKVCVLINPYAVDIADILKHGGVLAFDYRPNAKAGAKRYFDKCVLGDNGKVTGLSFRRYATYIAIDSLPESIQNAYWFKYYYAGGENEAHQTVYSILSHNLADGIADSIMSFVDADICSVMNEMQHYICIDAYDYYLEHPDHADGLLEDDSFKALDKAIALDGKGAIYNMVQIIESKVLEDAERDVLYDAIRKLVALKVKECKQMFSFASSSTNMKSDVAAA